MQQKSHQATTTDTNRLVTVAQTASSAEERERACHTLWSIYGERFVGVVAKASYLINSDFNLQGCSPRERQQNLMGNAYFVFDKAVHTFNTRRGVPFGAYIANMGKWRMADDKRKNASRSQREVYVDFMQECRAPGKDPCENPDVRTLFRATKYKPSFVEDIFRRDALQKIRAALQPTPKLAWYFDTCLEVYADDMEYSDAEVARRMGYTRANVGLLRKAMASTLKEHHLYNDFMELGVN